ncbi:MAG: hypothetical protein HY804_07105 [Nitrospinae bacterium]|nr:hypothetical protein [Nitrospinota bacterium]
MIIGELRRLVTPDTAARGVVMERTGSRLRVATARGLVEVPAADGVNPGDTVTIREGRITKPGGGGQVYWT